LSFVCATAGAGALDSVQPGTWYQFPNSRMDSVAPNPRPDGSLTAVMEAWGGGVYDSDRDQLVVWGGGHTDYAGNEVYAFGPLNGTSASWKRLTNPSNPPANNTEYASDGRPVSRHTYNLLAYLPAPYNKMMSCAIGSQYSGGSSDDAVDFYDFTIDGLSGQPWTRGAKASSTAAFGGICVYNSGTGTVWYHDTQTNSNRLQQYHPDTNTWTSHASEYLEIYYTAAIDPVRNLMVATGGTGGTGDVRVWDLNNPGSSSFTVATTGPDALEGVHSPGLVYDTVNNRFVGWSGGTTVYTLSVPSDPRNGTWTWATVPINAANTVTPTQPAGVKGQGYVIGTFGRFRYVPASQGVVVVNYTDENVYFFKLPNTGGSPPPTINFSANPTNVPAQGTTTLTWTTSNATSCTASGAWSGSKATSGSEAVGPLATNSTFSLGCTGAGGVTNRSVTVTVAQATPAPTVTLSANPTTVQSGGSSTLSWTTANANSCTASNGWTGTKATTGSENVGPLTQQKTYTLACTGSGGTTTKSVTVNVTPPTAAPTVSLAANPTAVTSGQTTMLTWSSQNATSCTASGAWSGTKSTSGSQQSAALTTNSTFKLACTGSGGTTQSSVTVTVSATTPPNPPPAMPTVTISAAPSTISANGSATLTWSSTDATSCMASGAWSGPRPTSGTEGTGALSSTATYTLDCTGSGGTAQNAVTVTVTAGTVVPPGGNPQSDSGGGGALGWLTLLFLGGLLLAGCHTAVRQQLAPSATGAVLTASLMAATVPSAHAAVDITSATVTTKSASAQTNVPVTFGAVFRPGDVPSGSSISATTSSGTALTVQVDKKATHADGSLRHAVLTLQLPSLAANGSQIVNLAAAASGSPGTAVKLSDLLATSFDAQVKLTVGGTVYTASARSLLQQGTPEQWLSGPLVSEWIVGGPVKTSAGVAHPHLAAYFHVRAFAGQPINRVRVDVVIENGWTFIAGPTSFNYTADISVGGASVYNRTLTHYHHTRWHRRFWWGSDPQLYVKADKDYLQSTGAVPRYPNLQPSAAYLNSMPQDSVPMENGDLTQNFPDTGAQDQIGPLPRWTTAYVLTTDERAFKAMLANDDSAASYSVHYRDETTGKPTSIADYPQLTTQFDDLPAPGGGNPNTADAAHQPSIAFVSYLMTGDYFYLEELQFWTSFNHLEANPLPPYGYRNGAQGVFRVQVRGQAWSIRNLAQAAYATPDTHRYKAELVSSVGFNLSTNEALYPDNASANKLGALQSYDGFDQFAPWMDDFYTWTMGYLVDLGFNANKMRSWKAKFPVGRMGTTDFCYIKASSYHLLVGSSDTVWWPDFATMYQQNFGALTSCPLGAAMDGYPDEPTGYPSNLRPALAAAVDSGIAGASDAWNRLVTSQPQPDYSDYANWSVIPRGSVSSGPSLTLTASPNPVQSGQNTTLTWTSVSATSCTASGAWTGTKATSGSESVGPISASTTYTLACTGNGQTVSRSVTVTIASAAAPTVSLSANPTSVAMNGNSTLTWSSTNATACTASGGWTGSKATSGTQSVGPLTQATTYTLSCSGSGGSAQKSVTVSVSSSAPKPTLALSATPSSVAAGGTSMLAWSSTNATACTASGGWTGSKATSGSQSVGPLNAATSYTLNCTGAGGSVQQSVTVAVGASPPPPAAPTVTLGANPESIAANATSELSWSTTNATSCSASDGWSGSKGLSGTETVGPLATTTTFTLSCTGAGGNASASATVAVTSGTGTGGGGSSSGSGGGGAIEYWLLACLAGLSTRRALRFARAPRP